MRFNVVKHKKKTRVVKTINEKEENAFQRTNKNAKLKKTLWSAGNANDQVLRRTDFFFFIKHKNVLFFVILVFRASTLPLECHFVQAEVQFS